MQYHRVRSFNRAGATEGSQKPSAPLCFLCCAYPIAIANVASGEFVEAASCRNPLESPALCLTELGAYLSRQRFRGCKEKIGRPRCSEQGGSTITCPG